MAAALLPPLLPTPTSEPIATSLLKTPHTDWTGKKPGRASASRSWIDDKFMDQRKPGRATWSKSWVIDKIAPAASDITSGERAGRVPSEMSGCDERVSRVTSDMGGGDRAGRGSSDTGGGAHAARAASDTAGGDRAGREESRIGWSTGKRPASRAPSTDRCDKKPKAPVEKEAAPAPEQLFAGPTFIIASPDPSELPVPYFFLKKAR